ncbi:MAG: hypothetical protein HZB68_05930 [Candidatus Aenigmarchaeota archaeon]|nr:hypothetical protein [Candidatus Aenigmarchaeota archaeon]
MDAKKLKRALRMSWSKETSYYGKDWDEENPSYGQCAVTALVVQDYLGGEILRGETDGYGPHFWNVVDGKEVDYTRGQFPKGTKITGGKKANRKRILSYNSVKRRYKALRDSVKSS